MAMHNEPDDQPAEIGTAEVCRILRVHPTTVGRLVESGQLTPALKLPGKNGAYVFSRADVEKLHAQRAARAASA